MTRSLARALMVLTTFHVTSAFGKPSDLSGTWKLDRERSRITAAAGLAGLIGAGAPEKLHITLAANGTLVVESEINESHARVYRPGGKTSTPVTVTGSITMTSRWDGRMLTSEGVLVSSSGASSDVREVLSFSEDGRTLSIDVTTSGAEGKGVSSLTYIRTETVDPCEKWPTPCKTPSN